MFTMLKQSLLIILFVLLCSFSFSQDKENDLLLEANAFYTNGEYLKAAITFNNLYEINNNNNNNKEDYLYFAAVSAVTAKEHKLALQYYLKLKNLDYKGITTEYYAINKATKKNELFSSRKVRDSLVKSSFYRKPRKRKTKSKKPEIVKNIALIYIELGENEKALQAVKYAIEENPKDKELRLTEANIYYKIGDIETFKKQLGKISKKERKNVNVLYNLGVVSAQSNQEKEAIKFYKRIIKINPNYINAYVNLSAIILNKEFEIIKEMNNLGNSKKDNNRYDELAIKRKDVYWEAIPYLEKVLEIDSNNPEFVKTLYSIYKALEQTEKVKALKLKFSF